MAGVHWLQIPVAQAFRKLQGLENTRNGPILPIILKHERNTAIKKIQDKDTIIRKKTMMSPIDKMLKQTNQGSYKTRHRYYDATSRFCSFLIACYKLQNFKHVKEQHIKRYSEYLTEQGHPASYIMTDLAGIRFFVKNFGNQHVLPKNNELNLDMSQLGRLDRAWTDKEIQSAVALAQSTERIDIAYAIKMASMFGMHLDEMCKCQVNHLKATIEKDRFFIRGKQTRYLNFQTEEQRELVIELLTYANKNERSGTDIILIDKGKGTAEKEKKAIQNWIANNRDKFEDKSKEALEDYMKAAENAKFNGVTLKRNLTFYGLQHAFVQKQYKFYRAQGYDIKQARCNVSEELEHHREAVTKVYMAE